jgi:hypothetical protein
MIFILDQLVSRDGEGEALHTLYRDEYIPGAEARGMKLVHRLVSPPLWLDDGANRLLFLWRLPDADGFWRKNNLGRRDPVVQGWWAKVDRLAASRRRDTLADPADFTRLADG